jgi:hypothetical protein
MKGNPAGLPPGPRNPTFKLYIFFEIMRKEEIFQENLRFFEIFEFMASIPLYAIQVSDCL